MRKRIEREYFDFDTEQCCGIKIGDIKGELTVVKFYYSRDLREYKVYFVECFCSCDKNALKKFTISNFRTSLKSCGCRQHIRTHGMSNTRLYHIYLGMKKRCYNPNSKRYYRYGARGIIVCDEWLNDFMVFYNWAMENGWDENNKKLTIERENNDKNYCPENCSFIPGKEQPGNRSCNIELTAWGETKIMIEWSKDPRCVVSYVALKARISRGKMGHEEAISTTSCKDKLYELQGERRTIAEWIEDDRCVINRSGLHRRLNTGWSFEEAILTPAKIYNKIN